MRSTRALTALALSLGLLTAACGGGGGGGDEAADGGETAKTTSSNGSVDAAQGGEFSLSLKEPTHLVPANTSDVYGGQVLSALFTGLVDYDPETGKPRNAMASSMESADQQNWTVTIKAGWKFHNDEAVTAQSFVDAWNFAAYAPNANENAFFFENIEGYEAVQGDPDATPAVAPSSPTMSGLNVVDETTFTVKLKEPFVQFPLMVGYNPFYPMPKAGLADPKAFEQQPIGNGPYMMDGPWKHDESIRLVRFDGYQGKAAGADAVELRIYQKEETAYRELQSDVLDVATSIPLPELAMAREELGDRLVERDSSAFNYLGFPLHRPEFQKKELRQAISLAIDRDAIIKAIFNGTRTPAKSVISPVVDGSRPDACKQCELNVAEAKKLLAAAGGFKGPLKLWFASGQDNEEPMEAIANQLRQNLGIEQVQFETLPFSEYRAKIKAKEVDGPFLLNWLMDYPSPQSYLQPLYTSTSASNRTGYQSPEVDKLIGEGNREASLEASVEQYQAAENIILDEMPVVPLWFGKTRAAHSSRITNVVIDPFSRIRLADVRVSD